MSKPSAAQRVLAIPELLDLVFRFSDRASNARCARVCKRWSAVALDCLWRDLPWMGHIFALLSPLVRESDRDPRDHSLNNTFKFVHRPSPDNWTRFFDYSSRVRRMEFNGVHRIIDDSVLQEIATSRPFLNLFPNLLQFGILYPSQSQMEHMIMLLHSNISKLVVELTPTGANLRRHMEDGPATAADTNASKSFIKEISLRTPHLTVLDVHMRYPVSILEDELCSLLGGLQSLKKLIMPPYTISDRIMTTLSTLPNIAVVQYEYIEEQGRGCPKDVSRFAPQLGPGAFPALYDLSFQANLLDASAFLNSPFAPSNLISLHIQTVRLECAADVRNCLDVLSRSCRQLTYLALDLHADLTNDGTLATVDVISFNEHLRPILAFPKLTTFDITYPRQLFITEDNLLEIATKWPALQTLILNVEPMSDEPPHLSFAALVPFATHCPHLTKLGLLMDTSSAALPVLEGTVPPHRFPSLTELRVGLPRIADQDAGPVSIYLSHVLPPDCKVNANIYWSYELVDDVMGGLLYEEHQVRHAVWGHVAEIVPLLARVRWEERRRMRELEGQVEDLKVRVRILEESRGMRDGGQVGMRMRSSPGCIPG